MLDLMRIRAGLLRRLRRALDFRVVRWYRLAQYQQAWYLRRLFKWQGIDLVIDVGGNEGQYARFIRKQVGYRGKLMTIEPIPALAQALQRQARGDPDWIIVNAALGASAGEVEFKIMNTSPMSSLLQPKQDSPSLLMQYNQLSHCIQVPMLQLDQLLAEHGELAECRNIYLKLDVQGYELEVLKGCEAVLARVGGLQAELSVMPLYENQPGYQEVLQFLDQAGYLPSLMPAHDYEQFPEMVDFDCHFVRRERLMAYLAERRGAAR